MTSPIRDIDWKVLLGGLERGNCVALVGPNLPTAYGNGASRNLATTLSNHLAELLQADEGVPVEDPDNLPLVAQIFSSRKARADLEAVASEFYEAHEHGLRNGGADDATFKNLAALPFQVFVSWRHDRTLDHFLRMSNRTPISESYDFKGNQRLTVGELGSIKRPLVYYLLGSTANPGSLALTESDLLDLLKAIVSGNPALPADLRNQFEQKSFLFLGCGLHRYYLRVLLHMLGLSKSEQRSFALEASPVQRNPEAYLATVKESVWFYSIGYRTLRLLDMGEAEFIKQLRERWESKHPGAFDVERNGSTPPPANEPTVFISYMTEDRAFATDFAKSLKANRVEPWLDINRFTSGDDWEAKLDDAIVKEVDFFIVLLGSHFGEGAETYVHLEITKALARKAKLGDVKFILPLKIHADAPLPKALERANIQATPVPDVAELASDIRRQMEKRRRRQS